MQGAAQQAGVFGEVCFNATAAQNRAIRQTLKASVQGVQPLPLRPADTVFQTSFFRRQFLNEIIEARPLRFPSEQNQTNAIRNVHI